MLTFDRAQVTERIVVLPKQLRIAFAAACTQRLLPKSIGKSAVNSRERPESAMRMLRELWDGVEQDAFDPKNLRRDFAACEALVAEYERGPNCADSEIDEDAILSLAHALNTALSGSSHDAMLAAESAYNALDDYIIQRFDVDVNTPGVQSLIDSFPVMQAELSRQQADLAELHAAAKNPGSEAAVITRIRRRAERDAISFFGSPSPRG
ncbi:MAG TPA: DUF416 family protein [Xanthobacteraceae bacterium]|jgi:hypothetical protein